MATDQYELSYSYRYTEPWLQQRTEVSIVKSAAYVQIEDPATPDHADRLRWANWAIKNSSVALISFMWSIALDPNVLAQGHDITDAEIDSITSAALPNVVKDFIANPPPGSA